MKNEDALKKHIEAERKLFEISTTLRGEVEYLDREMMYAKNIWQQSSIKLNDLFKDDEERKMIEVIPEIAQIENVNASAKHIIETYKKMVAVMKKAMFNEEGVYDTIGVFLDSMHVYLQEQKKEESPEKQEELDRLLKGFENDMIRTLGTDKDFGKLTGNILGRITKDSTLNQEDKKYLRTKVRKMSQEIKLKKENKGLGE